MKRKPVTPVRVQGQGFAHIYEQMVKLSKLPKPPPPTSEEAAEIDALLAELGKDPGFMVLTIPIKGKK